MTFQQSGSRRLCRINKFSVPAESRETFLELMAKTHAVLRQQEGVVTDRILEQQSGQGVFNFVAMIEFVGPEVIGSISAAVATFDRQAGIDRQQAMLTLNIKTDMGLYSDLDI